jgi:hypothetical protein
MPSWNIHTAHVEKLLADAEPASLGIADANAFLFGNLAPDVYVGYVVPDASRRIEYKQTHLARPDFIPKPNAALFYERYVRAASAKDPVDLLLGAWAHLLADHYYNLRTTEYIARIGVLPGEQTRIRKQGDFDVFGRTLVIRGVPKPTEELVTQCAAFPQYAIDKPDVLATIRAQQGIVRNNELNHVDGAPTYSLLTPEFFSQTFAEVDAVLNEALRMHVAGEDPTCFGRDDDMEPGTAVASPAAHASNASFADGPSPVAHTPGTSFAAGANPTAHVSSASSAGIDTCDQGRS